MLLQKNRRNKIVSKKIRDRKYRLPVKIFSEFSGKTFNGKYFVGNISTGGLFIETDTPAEEGEEVNIEITAPHNNEQRSFKAKVIWNRLKRESEGLSAGMGVEFYTDHKENLEWIEEVLNLYRKLYTEE